MLYGAGIVPEFIASMTISAPCLAGVPNGPAAGPVRNDTTPTFTVSFAFTDIGRTEAIKPVIAILPNVFKFVNFIISS